MVGIVSSRHAGKPGGSKHRANCSSPPHAWPARAASEDLTQRDQGGRVVGGHSQALQA